MRGTIRLDASKIRTSILIQIIACFFSTIFFIISIYVINSKYIDYALLMCILFLLLQKFPHEYAHYYALKLLRIRSKLKFGLLNSACIPEGVLNYKQLIFVASAPFLVFSLVGIILFFSVQSTFAYIILACYFCSIGCMAEDFLYIFAGLKYKKGQFSDSGHVLIVELR